MTDLAFELASDPRVPFVAPAPKTPVPYLNFAPLQNALARLRTGANTFEDGVRGITAPLPLATRQQLDQILVQCDRALLRPEGLPLRPWYRHQIYAPGFYTGYGVKTLPGVREAIEERRWDEAIGQIPLVAQTLEAMAQQIDRATALLGSGFRSPLLLASPSLQIHHLPQPATPESPSQSAITVIEDRR